MVPGYAASLGSCLRLVFCRQNFKIDRKIGMVADIDDSGTLDVSDVLALKKFDRPGVDELYDPELCEGYAHASYGWLLASDPARLREQFINEMNNNILMSALLMTITVPVFLDPPDLDGNCLELFIVFDSFAVTCQAIGCFSSVMFSVFMGMTPTDLGIVVFFKSGYVAVLFRLTHIMSVHLSLCSTVLTVITTGFGLYGVKRMWFPTIVMSLFMLAACYAHAQVGYANNAACAMAQEYYRRTRGGGKKSS